MTNLCITKQNLAKRLKQLREDKKISLEDLSKELKINQKWLLRAESGKANIEWYFLLKLADFYKKEINIMFN